MTLRKLEIFRYSKLGIIFWFVNSFCRFIVFEGRDILFIIFFRFLEILSFCKDLKFLNLLGFFLERGVLYVSSILSWFFKFLNEVVLFILVLEMFMYFR